MNGLTSQDRGSCNRASHRQAWLSIGLAERQPQAEIEIAPEAPESREGGKVM